jgi:hypothetical protein
MEKKGMSWWVPALIVFVTVLVIIIFGLIFTRNICAPNILITDDITASVEGQIAGLFDISDYGIRCVGEDGNIPKVEIEGTLKVVGCYIQTINASKDYNFTIIKIESLKGASTEEVKSWFITQEGDVINVRVPATSNKVANIIKLAPPKDISQTNIVIELEVKDNENGETELHEILLRLEKAKPRHFWDSC